MYISTIAGVSLDSNKLYRVTYSGASIPRHQDAIWKFTNAGRSAKDDNGVMVPSAHGDIIWHAQQNIVDKYRGTDPYLSVQRTKADGTIAGFEGTIIEVEMDNCVGYGTTQCGHRYDAGRYVPEIVIRDVPVTGPPRCHYCVRDQKTYEAEQAEQAKQAALNDRLNAALEARQAPVVDDTVVAGPVIVRQAKHVEQVEADENHPLAHLIPDISHYHKYISRTLNGINDFVLFEGYLNRHKNPLLEGPTESGKTQFVLAYAALKRLPLVTVPCNGAIDASSLFGSKTILPDGTVGFVYSNVTKVLQEGGILYFDEINFVPEKVLAVIHSATDDRRQVTIADLGYLTFDLHPNAYIWGSYNGGYAGTRKMNEATRRRFKEREWGYDEEVERQLIAQLPILHALKSEIRLVSAMKGGTGELETPLGPAKLMDFETDSIELGLESAIGAFLDSYQPHERETVQGIIDHHTDVLATQLAAVKARIEEAQDSQ